MAEPAAKPKLTVPPLTGLPLLAVALCVVVFVQAALVTLVSERAPRAEVARRPARRRGHLAAARRRRKAVLLAPDHVPDDAAARSAIDKRKADAAFVTGRTGSTLIVAPAAGAAMATALVNVFTAAAAAVKQPVAVVQVHTLPDR